MSLKCNITPEIENKATIQLLPNGSAWHASMYNDSTLYNFFLSISSAIVDFKKDACALIDEFFCTRHNKLSSEWFEEYGLPNQCDPRGETLCLLANGLDSNLGFTEILEDALQRIGITATVINEITNNIPLTISIILSPESPILEGCFYYAGGVNLPSSQTICGTPLEDLGCNATDPDDPSNPNSMVAVDADTYVTTPNSCGFIAGEPTIECNDELIASLPITGIIPDLSCVFEDFVPLGIKINYYLGNKTNPVLGG